MRAQVKGGWTVALVAAVVATTTSFAPLGAHASATIAAQDVRDASSDEDDTAGVDEASAYRAPLEVSRAEGLVPMLIPRDERLEFNARVKLVGIEADAGRVTLDAGVRPFQAGLFAQAADGAETAWIEARALGEYGVYSMDSRIETLFQPQAWPSLVNRFTQTGTESRRRELLVGTKDGAPHCSYRSDTSKGAPKGTRIWRNAQEYAVPAGTVDTIGAVYVVRAMIRDGRRVTTLNTLDKERVWEAALSLGEVSVVETPCGSFMGREVHLTTRLLSRLGEPVEPDPEDEGFTGPFGIRGQIRLFVEANTGIPIAISGTIPAGPIEIGLDIRLDGFEGTPPDFVPLTEEELAAALAAEAESEAANGDAEGGDSEGGDSEGDDSQGDWDDGDSGGDGTR